MERYDRKSVTRTPDGRHVLVATVRHAVAIESAVFSADEAGCVTSAMHLYKDKHGVADDLDHAHEAVVAAVQAGEIPLLEPDREPTLAEIEEAMGDLILLRKMAEDQAMDDETPNA